MRSLSPTRRTQNLKRACGGAIRTFGTGFCWTWEWAEQQPLGGRERLSRPGFREGGVELSAGADAELREDLAHVPLDGAWAEEQLGADLRVRVAVARELGDLCFLGGEVVAGLGLASA